MSGPHTSITDWVTESCKPPQRLQPTACYRQRSFSERYVALHVTKKLTGKY